jgi:acyl carrier protein
MNDLIMELAEALDWDCSSVTAETPLDSLSWDSMEKLTLIAVARVRGVSISGEKVREMKRVGDILNAFSEGSKHV